MLAFRRSKPLLFAAVLALIAVASLASPAWAQDPPENNGTVKIDDVPFDDLPNNEPHVGCTFQVDFYGYDEGDLDATVTFEAHPPTGERQLLLTDTVVIGEDDNSGGGSEAGLDASETYTLDFTGITPHPVQGFHVKLTINAEGSQGADVKHKVFWVTGCETPGPTTTTTAPTTTVAPSTTATTVCPTTTTAGPTTTTTGGATTTTGGATTTTGGATTTTLAPTTTVGETTTTKVDGSTTSTYKPPPSSSGSAALNNVVEETSTTHGATTTVPPTTVATSTSGAATTTTACPGAAAAGISADLTSDTSPFDATGVLPLAASVLVLLSVGTTSVIGWRRRRL